MDNHYELLIAMADVGHPLPRPPADVVEAQVEAALPILCAALKPTPVVIPYPAVLTVLAEDDRLDALTRAGADVHLADQVRWEAACLASAQAVARIETWLGANRNVFVVDTKIGRATMALSASGTPPEELVDQGEEATLQAINSGAIPAGPFTLLYLDEREAEPSFPGRHPVRVISLARFMAETASS